MNATELDSLFRLLEAYFQGDWTTERLAVWTDAFDGLDAHTCAAAIREMGQTKEFATVAAFLEIANRRPVEKPVYWDELRELQPPRERDTEAAVVHLSEMRKRLRGVS